MVGDDENMKFIEKRKLYELFNFSKQVGQAKGVAMKKAISNDLASTDYRTILWQWSSDLLYPAVLATILVISLPNHIPQSIFDFASLFVLFGLCIHFLVDWTYTKNLQRYSVGSFVLELFILFAMFKAATFVDYELGMHNFNMVFGCMAMTYAAFVVYDIFLFCVSGEEAWDSPITFFSLITFEIISMSLFYVQFIKFFANPWILGCEIILVSLILFIFSPKPRYDTPKSPVEQADNQVKPEDEDVDRNHSSRRIIYRLIFAILLLICIFVLGNTAFHIFRERHVNILNWDLYISQSAIRSYQENFDTKVNYDTYDSNEEALELVQQRKGGYDIVFPSDYMMTKMKKLGLLGIVDYTKISNIENINSTATDLFRNNGWLDHCAPYLMGTTGFAVHQRRVDVDANTITWQKLSSIVQREMKKTDDPNIPKVALIDDGRQILSSIILELGDGPNSPNQDSVDRALQLLLTIIPSIEYISSKQVLNVLEDDKVDIVFGWSGDILQVINKKPAWRYSVPISGGIGFFDGVCLLKDAPSGDLALEMINHLLNAKIHTDIVRETQYITSNDATIRMLGQTEQEAMRLASGFQVNKLFFLNELSDEENGLISLAWDKIKNVVGKTKSLP